MSIEFANACPRTVRLDAIRVDYLRDDEVVGGEDPGERFFREAVVPRARGVEPDRHARWVGVCLADPPPAAGAARVDIDVSVRRGLGRRRDTIRVPVGLVDLPPPVRLRLPFIGTWAVSQAHRCHDDHRLAGHGGEYAWDFVALDGGTSEPLDRSWRSGRANEDTVGFDLPVLAPAAGTVVRVVDEIPDNEGSESYPRRSILDEVRRPEWGLGNHVVIGLDDGVHVLLGHLRLGSIAVRTGQRVRPGETIARCGNSGNSIVPHLHLQVMDRPDPSDSDVRSLPAAFVDYRETVVAADGDRRDALIRDVSLGHPEEGGLVRPIGVSEGDRGGGSSPPPSASRP